MSSMVELFQPMNSTVELFNLRAPWFSHFKIGKSSIVKLFQPRSELHVPDISVYEFLG